MIKNLKSKMRQYLHDKPINDEKELMKTLIVLKCRIGALEDAYIADNKNGPEILNEFYKKRLDDAVEFLKNI